MASVSEDWARDILSKSGPMESTLHEALMCDYVRFTVADFNGVARSKLVTRRHLSEFFQSGVKVPKEVLSIGCHGKFPDGGSPMSLHNAALIPLSGTLHHVTWAGGDYRIGEILCEMCHVPDLIPMEACPRVVARHQLAALEEEGYGIVSSFEPQFVLQKGEKPLFTSANYLSGFDLFQQEPFLCDLVAKLYSIGVDAETIQNEPSKSQFRVYIRPFSGIKTADNNFIMKKAIKEIAHNANMTANFMTVPGMLEDGNFPDSGLFFNHSLVDKDSQNVFQDMMSNDVLSAVYKHWMGGLLAHAPGLMALFCPAVNCYRRYPPLPPSWAIEDRHVAYRTKLSMTGAYIECRVPGAAANPYLVMAGVIAAGLDGLRKQRTCLPERDSGGVALPRTLSDALTALEQDTILVEALGEKFVKEYVSSKKNVDLIQLSESDVADLNDLAGFAREYDIYSHL